MRGRRSRGMSLGARHDKASWTRVLSEVVSDGAGVAWKVGVDFLRLLA